MSETRLITRDGLGCFAGQSSMCWIPTPSTQVFDSENAVKQLDELWNSLPLLSDLQEVCWRLCHMLDCGNYCPACGRWKPDNHLESCEHTKAKAILEELEEGK